MPFTEHLHEAYSMAERRAARERAANTKVDLAARATSGLDNLLLAPGIRPPLLTYGLRVMS